MLPVPYNPEPLESLQARYPAALATVFDIHDVRLGKVDGPAWLAANIFDFEDGLRLIVSREKGYPHTRAVIVHVSASCRPDSPMAAEIVDQMRATRNDRQRRQRHMDWCNTIGGRFRELSGNSGKVIMLGVSQHTGIPHFQAL